MFSVSNIFATEIRDVDKENIHPNVLIQVKGLDTYAEEKDNQEVKISKTQQEDEQEFWNNKKVLALELSGHLKEDHLCMLKDTTYEELYFHRVFGYNNKTYFYRNHLNISPETINKNIKVLCLQACGLVSKNIRGISLLGQLEKLYLSANPIIDEDVKLIMQLVNLKVLHLASTKIGNIGVKLLAQIPSLIELDISSNFNITDEGFKSFSNNKTIKKLNVETNNISKETYKLLKREGIEIKYFPDL